MSRSTGTTTPFRLARDEAIFIRLGLLQLISAYRHWQGSGASPISLARSISISHLIDEGKFSQECQAAVLHVAVVATNSFKAKSRRLRLDSFELAACLHGVRITEMMARHGHLKPCPPCYKVRARRLLKRLERLRKRAKRAYLGVHGQAAFAEARHRWQQCVHFVRAFFLYCTCNRTLVRDPGGKALRRMKEDEWMNYFREELPAQGREIPPEPELRRLVKRARRVGRRLLRQWGRITAQKNHDLLQERMTNYVVRRCRKSNPAEAPEARSRNF